MTAPSDMMLPTRGREFWAGVRATFPLVVGGIPFGIIFGALAIANGLSPMTTVAMSLFVYAGSAQFIASGLVAAATAIPVIILTTFVVNLRHVLYSATLAPYMRHLSQKWLLLLGFWLTDETFVVVVTRYQSPDDSPYKHWYHVGSSLAMYVPWVLSTIFGVFAGSAIPDPTALGLDFAMYVTFIGMLIPLIKTRPILISVVVASVTAVLTNGLPNRFGLMAAAILGVVAGVIAETTLKSSEESSEMPSDPVQNRGVP